MNSKQENPRPNYYRDENNLAEFPIAILGARSEGANSLEPLVFRDTIRDPQTKQPVTRALKVIPSAKYGPPTPRDDEVLLGIIQLSSRTNFASQKVFFKQRELLSMLGWGDGKREYVRLEESLRRFATTTLEYDNAWWDSGKRRWVTCLFHLFNEVRIYKRNDGKSDGEGELCYIEWNKHPFQSFQDGYLRAIDLDLFNSLRSPIAKRMYRFLGKRFYHNSRFEMELRTFALEKIGISKDAPNPEIKRRLQRGFDELIEVEFIKRASEDERYRKIAHGVWHVVIEAGKAGAAKSTELLDVPQSRKVTHSSLAKELEKRGVDPAVAKEMCASLPQDKIEEKIAYFDHLQSSRPESMRKNPAGFLVSALKRDFVPSDDFQRAKVESENLEKAQRNADARKRQDELLEKKREEMEDAEARKIEAFWKSLTQSEQERIEAEALRATDAFSRKQYESRKGEGGSLFKAVRNAILRSYLKKLLMKREGE